jgi:peptidoglycan/LPS O-acetylase OafA/YrhL
MVSKMKSVEADNRRLPGLHGLRALAALAIVTFHTFGINKLQMPEGAQWLTNYLGLGVPLFFVISAFSLFLSTRHRLKSDSWVRDYLLRRFFRIAPLFYVAILFYCAFIPLRFGASLTRSDIVLSASFLFNLFPGKHESVVWAGWTIGVEMLFYLAVPFLLVSVRTVWQAVLAVLVALVVSRVMYGYYQGGSFPENYAYLSLMGSIAVFAYGIPAYFVYEHAGSLPAESRKSAAWAILLLSGLLCVAIVVAEEKLYVLLGNRSNIWGALFSMLVVAASIHPVRFVSSRPMAWLGERSFGLYLCHPPVIETLRFVHADIYNLGLGNGWASLLCVATTLAITVPIAELVYRFIERPGIRQGEKFVTLLTRPARCAEG